VKADLEKEEKDLIHMKEAIQQRLKVLQAEAVTIQRLLHAHSRQLEGGGGEQMEEESHTEPPPDQLPELNLDIELDARKRWEAWYLDNRMYTIYSRMPYHYNYYYNYNWYVLL